MIKHKDFQQTPLASIQPKFLVIALDYKIAGVTSGVSEAILLYVTNYFTSVVLLN